MKKILIISSLVLVWPFSVHAKGKEKAEAVPPSPPNGMHHRDMMPPPYPGGRRHGMMMPRKKPLLKSELHIRARLKDLYNMSDEDINTVLKARQEILGVMQKYMTPADGAPLPPPPIF